jgi:hypothetical protein
MTILEPTKGGNVVEVCQPCAVPACWQCESVMGDWQSTRRGYCSTLGNRLRKMGLPVVGDVPVAMDGDPAMCGEDFVLTVKAFDELVSEGFAVPYASDEVWQAWMLEREQIA